jgi:ankyrin repeat protein
MDEHARAELQVAVNAGLCDLAHGLLEGARDASAIAEDPGCLLYRAVATGNEAMLAVLLEHGVGNRAARAAGMRPLHLAARLGATRMVELLLGHGADAVARDEVGRTALDDALRAGRANTARALSEASRQ